MKWRSTCCGYHCLCAIVLIVKCRNRTHIQLNRLYKTLTSACTCTVPTEKHAHICTCNCTRTRTRTQTYLTYKTQYLLNGTKILTGLKKKITSRNIQKCIFVEKSYDYYIPKWNYFEASNQKKKYRIFEREIVHSISTSSIKVIDKKKKMKPAELVTYYTTESRT